MSCRALIPNSSTPPIFRTKRHTSAPGGCCQRWIPADGRWRNWPVLRREPYLLSGPCAVLENGGMVSELPETKGSFYDLLGIPETGSPDDVKRAYKQLARKYHPDVSPPGRTEEYTRRFIEVKEAYETLSDPGYRALYDRYLSSGLCLAFSTRRQFDEELEEKSGWKNRWQDQLEKLRRRSMVKNSNENLSWGARMRRRSADSSTA